MKREEFSRLIDATFKQNIAFGSIDSYRIEFKLLVDGNKNLDLTNLVKDFWVAKKGEKAPKLSEIPKPELSNFFHSMRMEYFKPLLSLASTQEGKDYISHLFASNEHNRQCHLAIVKQWENTLEYIKSKGSPITIENKLIQLEEQRLASIKNEEINQDFVFSMFQVAEESSDNLLIKRGEKLPNGKMIGASRLYFSSYHAVYNLLSDDDNNAIIDGLARYMRKAMEANNLYVCKYQKALEQLCCNTAPFDRHWDDTTNQIIENDNKNTERLANKIQAIENGLPARRIKSLRDIPDIGRYGKFTEKQKFRLSKGTRSLGNLLRHMAGTPNLDWEAFSYDHINDIIIDCDENMIIRSNYDQARTRAKKNVSNN